VRPKTLTIGAAAEFQSFADLLVHEVFFFFFHEAQGSQRLDATRGTRALLSIGRPFYWTGA
jgi:hypothetical protein